jgi:Protein of unknown function (DUF1566)
MRPLTATLAVVVGSVAAPGCRRDPAPTGNEPSATAPKGPQRCHAARPMPNLRGSGLPNLQTLDSTDADLVSDRLTKLDWQRVVDPRSFDQRRAASYCAELSLAGHRDWRLPAMIELVSIADTSKADPAADPVAFPNTPPVPFWSSQTDSSNAGLGWYVFFKNGGAYVGNDVIDPARVRCVRGPSSCSSAQASAYRTDGAIARDVHTGLAWQRAVDRDAYAWDEAKSYCARLDVEGGEWRLPSVRELLTLVDVTRMEPAIDLSAFPDTPSEFFWSSSPSVAPAKTAWGVNFTRGSSGAALVDTVHALTPP